MCVCVCVSCVQAQFEADQAEWVQEKTLLTSRNENNEEALASIEALEETAPDADSMPDALLTEKETITERAATRVDGPSSSSLSSWLC